MRKLRNRLQGRVTGGFYGIRNRMCSYKVLQIGTPAKAGVKKRLKKLDSRLRGNNNKKGFSTFYETVK